jgi:ABC-type cobalamin/Fe3+-siderophores transport system ATPase subunit
MIISELLENIAVAANRYHKLVLIVGRSGAGKTKTLEALSKSASAPIINVGRELSSRLLDIPARHRDLEVLRILDDVLGPRTDAPALLDNLEVLFEPTLQQDPLQVLQRLSRSRTIVAAWNGELRDDQLIYANAGHPEARRYPANGLLLVTLPTKD